MSTIDVVTAARALEGESPLEILRWASRNLGSKLTFATGFGAEGCVLIELIARDHLPIDLFTLDTGVLFPETYELWRQLEARYGVTIRAVRPAHSIEQQAVEHGPALWERDPDRCCELRKVLPLRRALTGFEGWITAIRREPKNAANYFWLGKAYAGLRKTRQAIDNYESFLKFAPKNDPDRDRARELINQLKRR